MAIVAPAPCRVLDAVAVSSEDYKLWIDGLQLVLHLGSINTTKVLQGVRKTHLLQSMLFFFVFFFQVLSALQNVSGGEPKPIP